MKYFKNLRFLLIFVFLAIIVVSGGFLVKSSQKNPGLKVVFFNVGQGDSELIQSQNGYQILIDGGPKGDVIIEKLSHEMPPWERKIDLIILSHPHSDHVSGLVEVLKRYNVGQILATDAVNTSPQFLEWLNLIKEKKIPFQLSKDISEIDLGGGAKADILYPKESYQDKKIKDLNDTSIILLLEYRGVSFLFTGDAGQDVQARLLTTDYRPQPPITFLKIPHHGSKTALEREFLEKVSPTIAVISVGKNTYGHPSSATLEMLTDVGAKIYRTDKDGDVKVTVDENGKWSIK